MCPPEFLQISGEGLKEDDCGVTDRSVLFKCKLRKRTLLPSAVDPATYDFTYPAITLQVCY